MQNTPDWITNRLLNFLNRARDAKSITDAPELKDDPESGSSKKGYVIGEKVAQQIVDFKKTLNRRRFQQLDEILAVPGLGQDKLNDLLHSFSTSADAYFRQQLFRPIGPLYDNWELTTYSKTAASEADFHDMTNGLDRLKTTAAELLPTTDSRRGQLRASYIATFGEAHPAAYQFTTWWYGFDQDNWFAFDTIRSSCERYLDYHANGDMIFGFFYLYGPRGGAYNRIGTQDRIPFVINVAEQKVTLWQASLND